MPLTSEQITQFFRVSLGSGVKLSDHHTGWAQTVELAELGRETVKERAQELLRSEQQELSDRQELLYADNRYSLLVIFQGMDASGKDGTIRHVMSGINPQGCRVTSFKQPSAEELDHTFLWRYAKCVPERGCIGIFNRSWYEEVLVVRVHPPVLAGQQLPPGKRGKSFWQQRFEDINAFEQHLVRNGTQVVKIMLNISKGEQKQRFLERLERPESTGNFRLVTWQSGGTGTHTCRLTRNRWRPPAQNGLRGTSCRRTRNGWLAVSSPASCVRRSVVWSCVIRSLRRSNSLNSRRLGKSCCGSERGFDLNCEKSGSA